MRRSIDPMCFQLEDGAGADPDRSCDLIVPMSLQLAIPWRVALQQSSPPLRQSRLIMPQEPSVRQIEIGERQPYLKVVSHTRGSVQERLSYVDAGAERRRSISGTFLLAG